MSRIRMVSAAGVEFEASGTVGGSVESDRGHVAGLPPSRLAPGAPWFLVIAIVPYVLLAVVVVVTIVVDTVAGRRGNLVVDLGLCAIAAAWILFIFTVQPRWQRNPRMMVFFVAGFIVILAVMVAQEPWFGILVVAGYLYVFALIRWPWQLIVVFALGIIAGSAQLGLPFHAAFSVPTFVGIVAANVVVMGGFAWLNHAVVEEDDERQRSLAEVNAANRRLAVALDENARLQKQLVAHARGVGVLAERQRMAREIHDTLAQGLVGIITQLEAADRFGAGTERDRHLGLANSLARDSLAEARRSILSLQPQPESSAAGTDLVESLASLARSWSDTHQPEVAVTTSGTPRPVSAEVEFVILRTAREALANVAKHAEASRVVITLSYLGDSIAIDIRDDGRGIAGTPAQGVAGAGFSGGFGLVAMRQRITELDGTLQIESEPGKGTAVTAHLPATTPEAGIRT